jgi:hypothetical protein
VEDCDDGDDLPGGRCSRDCLLCEDPLARATHVTAAGHCYAWYDTVTTFAGAERACDLKQHAVIASFDSRAQELGVRAGLGVTSEPVWIGLNDRNLEETFLWVTGTAADYTNWATGSPLAGDDNNDCVAWDAAGLWTDVNCATQRGYVCEREPWTIGLDGHAYLFVKGATADWVEAQLRCRDLFAELVSVTSSAEQDLVAGDLTFPTWLGLTERGHDGTLAWSTGESMSFDGFLTAPNLSGDAWCARAAASGEWLLSGCFGRNRYVCESR